MDDDKASNFVTPLTINQSGAMTKPLQPAFLVQPSSQQSNFAIDSSVVVAFGTEKFDQNADFASNTFTAPVTGKYQLNAHLRIEAMDTGATYFQLRLNTSNETYSPIISPVFSGDASYWTLQIAILADMDANDTATVYIRQQGGTAQGDIDTESYFSGYLAC